MKSAFSFFIGTAVPLFASGVLAVYGFDYYEADMGKVWQILLYLPISILIGLLVSLGAGVASSIVSINISLRQAYGHAFLFGVSFTSVLWLLLIGNLTPSHEIALLGICFFAPFSYVYLLSKI